MNENKEYKIEFAKFEDTEDIADLYDGWKEFSGILPNELLKLDTADDLAKYFNRENSPRKFIVAKSKNNKVIGVCYLDITWQGLKNIRLGDMFVHKEFRNIGIGSALVDKAIEYAKENNIKKIWLWTQEELKDTIRLYEKKGFKPEGIQKAQFCGKDALLYGLVL